MEAEALPEPVRRTPEADPALEPVLEFLRRARGADFSGYRRSTLERRLRRRMEALGCGGVEAYLDHLEVHPDEYEQLFAALLVDVTEFFRDPPAWQRLREDVLPSLLEAGDPVRAWSAGCASGQEPYTLAMLLAESLGVDAYRERVKIYATDIDQDALAQAGRGVYTAKEAESVPPELRTKYFEPAGQRLALRPELRGPVVFGRHDLLQDAPISRLDLLICRNTLLYFTAETQARIVRRFHFALRDTGVLMLGRSETLTGHRDRFSALDAKARLFRRRPSAPSPDAPGRTDQGIGDAALEVAPHAQIVVSETGRLSSANLAARELLQITLEDIGRPLDALAVARRPVDLPAAIEQATREGQRVRLGEVEYTPADGEPRRLDIDVTAMPAPGGAAIALTDVTRHAALQAELDGSRRDLELAYEELQSTIDELEATNEELQSANEQLQATNDELQSTNDELETMNEALQSANGELGTINAELGGRTGELDEVNRFLESILASLGLGVAVLDARQRVRIWSERAQDLWGLAPDEAVDRHFLSLDIGLAPEQLAGALRSVLTGASAREVRELEAVDRHGRPIVCAATVLPLGGPAGSDGADVRGAIVMMEDRER